jgi:hypothetical protein
LCVHIFKRCDVRMSEVMSRFSQQCHDKAQIRFKYSY